MWQLVAAFTNSTVKLEARKGGLFSLLDGLISGEYMELVSIEIASVYHNIHLCLCDLLHVHLSCLRLLIIIFIYTMVYGCTAFSCRTSPIK